MIIPLILGIVSVLQAGMNEKMISRWGLSATVMINTVVLLAVSILMWRLAVFFPTRIAEELQVSNQSGGWQWWYLVPGVFGYILVAGIPVSFSLSGAAMTMTLLVTSQIAAGFGWDLLIDKAKVSTPQVVGALLAVAAAVVSSMGKN